MNAPILVTGGTGTIGVRVVPLLRAAGANVRILSRHPRGDEPGIRHLTGNTVTGQGLDAAHEGIGTVLHLAGGAKGDDVAARNIATASASAGVDHVVMISVVGAGAVPIGYFRAKYAAEQEIAGAGVPWTVLRSAQLHEFVLPVVKGLARLPVTPAPTGLRFEPVHVDDVAARLVELTLGEPGGLVADVVGPEVLDIPHLVTTYAKFHGRRHPAIPVRLPGAVGRAYRAGANLAGTEAVRTRRGWAQFLAERAATTDSDARAAADHRR